MTLPIPDLLVLKNLQKVGPKTRFQLQTLGLSLRMIDQLETLGVLVKEHDNATNLNYYTVNNGIFDGT